METIHLVPALAPSGGEQGNPLMGFIPILLVFVIFYLLILRPQQRKQKEHQQMVESLGKGDQVVTNGGLFATVLNVKDDRIVASIADGVKVELAKTAVSARVKSKKG